MLFIFFYVWYLTCQPHPFSSFTEFLRLWKTPRVSPSLQEARTLTFCPLEISSPVPLLLVQSVLQPQRSSFESLDRSSSFQPFSFVCVFSLTSSALLLNLYMVRSYCHVVSSSEKPSWPFPTLQPPASPETTFPALRDKASSCWPTLGNHNVQYPLVNVEKTEAVCIDSEYCWLSC